MKKLFCIILACCVFLPCLMLPTGAADSDPDAIVLRLNSDVAGCTAAEYENLIEIVSGPVRFSTMSTYPVDINYITSAAIREPMTAGRAYYVTYYLIAEDGYTLPDELGADDVTLELGKGVEVILCGIVDYYISNGAPREGTFLRTLRIVAKVVVDSNAFQRIIGWLSDLILKIRSWQLY